MKAMRLPSGEKLGENARPMRAMAVTVAVSSSGVAPDAGVGAIPSTRTRNNVAGRANRGAAGPKAGARRGMADLQGFKQEWLERGLEYSHRRGRAAAN